VKFKNEHNLEQVEPLVYCISKQHYLFFFRIVNMKVKPFRVHYFVVRKKIAEVMELG